jgi:hypothetical protein
MPRPIIIDERPLYLKGYKIDRLKILEFPTLPDDPQNLRYLWLWKEFPLPFLYLAVGRDSVGEKSLACPSTTPTKLSPSLGHVSVVHLLRNTKHPSPELDPVFYSRYASKEMAHLFSAEVFSTPIDDAFISTNLPPAQNRYHTWRNSGSLSPLPRSSSALTFPMPRSKR